LATPVPANWLPLLPTGTGPGGGSRASHLRLGGLHEPHGALLAPDGGAPTFHEEEIPRVGLLVGRRSRRARGADGSVYLWTAYERRIGPAGPSSGLLFDVVDLDPAE
jgi:hypothetical protein